MSSLRSVVYVSSATYEMSTAELELLLVVAKAANRANRISGILLYSEGNIMQCFEGPEDSVAATYTRIRASKRHRNILELMNEPIAHRNFEEWEMALVKPTSSELIALSSARWKAQAAVTPSASAGGDGLELLQTFWRSALR